MERIGVRELRQHASRYLDRVKAGETIEVTNRGEVVAVLSPVRRSRLDEQRAAGWVIPATASLDDLPPPIELPGAVMSEILDEQRAERL